MTKLDGVIQGILMDNSLDKYGSLKKPGITLLIILNLIFSPIKKWRTGSYLDSTLGKSKEAVLEIKDKLDKLKKRIRKTQMNY